MGRIPPLGVPPGVILIMNAMNTTPNSSAGRSRNATRDYCKEVVLDGEKMSFSFIITMKFMGKD